MLKRICPLLTTIQRNEGIHDRYCLEEGCAWAHLGIDSKGSHYFQCSILIIAAALNNIDEEGIKIEILQIPSPSK